MEKEPIQDQITQYLEEYKDSGWLTEIKDKIIEAYHSNPNADIPIIIADYLINKEYFYTVRDDEKPEMYVYIEGIYVPFGKTFVKEATELILGTGYKKRHATRICDIIEAKTYVEPSVFFEDQNKHPYLLPVQNGLLHLKTREFYEFSPHMVLFNKLPVYYDAEANGNHIQDFIRSVLENDEDFMTLQEIFGYCLVRTHDIEKAFMLYGKGRNGKSKVMEILKRMLGMENCTSLSIQDMEEKQFSMGCLHNKLANISSDLPRRSIKDSSVFKAITGNDMVEADRKFKNTIKFTNYSKQIFACNDLPHVYSDNLAFWNRWTLINFPFTFIGEHEYENHVKELTDSEKKLVRIRKNNVIGTMLTADNMSSLLNWSIAGLDRVFLNGDFTKNQFTENIRNEWIRKSNSFAAFFSDMMGLEHDNNETKRDVKSLYVDYCHGFGLKPVSDMVIGRFMRDLGVDGGHEYRVMEEGGKSFNKQFKVWDGVKFIKRSVSELITKNTNILYNYPLYNTNIKNNRIYNNKYISKAGNIEKNAENSTKTAKNGQNCQKSVHSPVYTSKNIFSNDEIDKKSITKKILDFISKNKSTETPLKDLVMAFPEINEIEAILEKMCLVGEIGEIRRNTYIAL